MNNSNRWHNTRPLPIGTVVVLHDGTFVSVADVYMDGGVYDPVLHDGLCPDSYYGAVVHPMPLRHASRHQWRMFTPEDVARVTTRRYANPMVWDVPVEIADLLLAYPVGTA